MAIQDPCNFRGEVHHLLCCHWQIWSGSQIFQGPNPRTREPQRSNLSCDSRMCKLHENLSALLVLQLQSPKHPVLGRSWKLQEPDRFPQDPPTTPCGWRLQHKLPTWWGEKATPGPCNVQEDLLGQTCPFSLHLIAYNLIISPQQAGLGRFRW